MAADPGTVAAPRLRRGRGSPTHARAVRADPAAFAEVYTRHQEALYRYCLSILRHEADARDALQSTMTKAFAALRTEERDFELRPWLFRIAHNESISILRRRPATEELDRAEGLGADAVLREVAARHRLAHLADDLADLPERQRAALVLRELNGLGHEEIAGVLGCTARAVKQAIFEARTALHTCEQGRAMGCEAVTRLLSDADGRTLRGRGVRAHLRSCASCRAFRDALERRPAELAALAPPLPVAASLAVLAGILPGGATTGAATTGASSASGASSAAGGAAAVSPATTSVAGSAAAVAPAATTSVAASAAASSAAAFAAKAAVAIALVAAGAGTTAVAIRSGASAPIRRGVEAHRRAAPAAAGHAAAATAEPAPRRATAAPGPVAHPHRAAAARAGRHAAHRPRHATPRAHPSPRPHHSASPHASVPGASRGPARAPAVRRHTSPARPAPVAHAPAKRVTRTRPAPAQAAKPADHPGAVSRRPAPTRTVPTSPASSAHAPSHAAAGTGIATTPQASHGRS